MSVAATRVDRTRKVPLLWHASRTEKVRRARLSAMRSELSRPGPVASGTAAAVPGGTAAGAEPGEDGRSVPSPGGGPGGPGGACAMAAAGHAAAARRATSRGLAINADHLVGPRGDPDVPRIESQGSGGVRKAHAGADGAGGVEADERAVTAAEDVDARGVGGDGDG